MFCSIPGTQNITKVQGKRDQHVDPTFVLGVGPTCWARLHQCVEPLGPTFRKYNDIVMTSLISCDCVAFETFFHSRSWRTNKCLKLW